jgi:hypothetical protein
MPARNWREWLNDFQTFKVSEAMAKLKTLKVA